MGKAVWTADIDTKLFLTILATSNITINYPVVAEKMGVSDSFPCLVLSDLLTGIGMTPSAIVQRMFKLRQKAKEREGSESTVTATTADPEMPKVKGRGRVAKSVETTSASTKRKADGNAFKKESSDEDRLCDTPNTPIKTITSSTDSTPSLTPTSDRKADRMDTPATPTLAKRDTVQVMTPAATPVQNKVRTGRVEKGSKRVSPRKGKKHISYAELVDPFSGIDNAVTLLGIDKAKHDGPQIELSDEVTVDDYSDDGDVVVLGSST